MKINRLILLASFLLLLMAGAISCSKGQAPDTPFTQIQGNWKYVQYATDDNNNGTIDPSEIQDVPAWIDDHRLFTGADTGEETNVDSGEKQTPLSFDWKIIGSDSLWMAYQANDTLIYYIAQLSSHNLQLNIITQFGLAAYFYSK